MNPIFAVLVQIYPSCQDDSVDDAQSDSSEMGEFIERSYDVLFVPDTDVECVAAQSK